jgi:thiamine-phosphate pyrophosphorylase
LTPPVVCLVTGDTTPADLTNIRNAALAGLDLVQVRERTLDDRSLVILVRAIVQALEGTATRVVVNDRVDVALAARAAGVHLRGDSIAAPDARRVLPDGAVVGRSVHSVTEALEAERAGGCDYLVFGTVFPSASKPAGHQAAGIAALQAVCTVARLPVLAIGGVTTANAHEVAAAGAAGVAAIGAFAGAERVADTIAAIRRAFDTCYPHRR